MVSLNPCAFSSFDGVASAHHLVKSPYPPPPPGALRRFQIKRWRFDSENPVEAGAPVQLAEAGTRAERVITNRTAKAPYIGMMDRRR